MSTSQSKESKAQLGLSNSYGAEANANQGQLFNSLDPMLTAEATNPQGYSTSDLNAMTGASNDALGGAVSGAVGQGNLEAARTRNGGGYSAALDQAVRDAGKTASTNAQNVQIGNANLKNTQQQAGMEGLQGLYGTNTSELNSMLGLGPSTLSAGKQPGAFQTALGDIESLYKGGNA